MIKLQTRAWVNLTAAACFFLAGVAGAKETIVFVRHGEKPAGSYGQLTCQGLNRALALPRVLVSSYGKPNFVFAPDPSGKVGDGPGMFNYVRPLATIEPTAISLGMPVQTPYPYTNVNGMASLLNSDTYDNALVFVAWEHLAIVQIARAIVKSNGGDSSMIPDWADSDFDSMYVLTIDRAGGRPKVSFTHDREGLDDRSTACPH